MHLRTKRLGIGGVVAGGLMLGAAALVIGAGLARADSTKGHEGDMSVPALIAEEAPYGANLTPEVAMRVALNICGGHAMGYTRDQMIATTLRTSTTEYAVTAVMAAEYHFCPQYDSLHLPEGIPVDPSVPPTESEWAPEHPMTLAHASYQTKRGNGGHKK